MFYVGMTRGREQNIAHVVTGPPDPAGMTRAEREAFARGRHRARRSKCWQRGDAEGARAVRWSPPEPEPGCGTRAPWEAVLAEVMHRDDPAGGRPRADEGRPGVRHEHAAPARAVRGVLVERGRAADRRGGTPARSAPREYERYLRDPERPAFLQALRTHEIGGRAIEDSLDAITAAPLDGPARSPRSCTAAWEKNRPPRGGRRGPGLSGRRAGAAPQTQRGIPDARRPSGRARPRARRAAAAVGAPGMGDASGTSRARCSRTGSSGPAGGLLPRGRPGSPTRRQAIGPVPPGQARSGRRSTPRCAPCSWPTTTALLRAMGRGELEARVAGTTGAAGRRARPTSRPSWTRPRSIEPQERAGPRHARRRETRPPRRGRRPGRRCTARAGRAAGRRRGAPGMGRGARRVGSRGRDSPSGAAGPRPGRADPGHGRRGGRGLGAEPRDVPVIDPAEAARWKAEQTAHVEADREARAEAAAQADPGD